MISVMIQSILTNSLGAWKGEQDTDSSESRRRKQAHGDTDDQVECSAGKFGGGG